MVLNKYAIKAAIKSKAIEITPFDEEHINPNGYELHLGSNIYVSKSGLYDLKKDQSSNFILNTIDDNGFVLLPGTFILGVSIEHTRADKLLMMYDGKSSLGRLGVETHICAGAGDIGFQGHWTLEIRATHPTIIYPGMPVGQIMFNQTIGMSGKGYEAFGSYNNKYSESPLPVISNFHTKKFIKW